MPLECATVPDFRSLEEYVIDVLGPVDQTTDEALE
jgi:hypothetical protein